MGGFALVKVIAGGIFDIYEDARQIKTGEILHMLDIERLAAAADKGGHALPLHFFQFLHEMLKTCDADRAPFALVAQGPGVAHNALAAGAARTGKAQVAVLEFGAVRQKQRLRPCRQHFVKTAVGGEDAVAVLKGDAVAGNGGLFQSHAQGNADIFRPHVRYDDSAILEEIFYDAAQMVAVQGLTAQGGLKIKKRPRRK